MQQNPICLLQLIPIIFLNLCVENWFYFANATDPSKKENVTSSSIRINSRFLIRSNSFPGNIIIPKKAKKLKALDKKNMPIEAKVLGTSQKTSEPNIGGTDQVVSLVGLLKNRPIN